MWWTLQTARTRLRSHWILNSPWTVKYIFLVVSWTVLMCLFLDPGWKEWGLLIICVWHDVDHRSMSHWLITIRSSHCFHETGTLSTVVCVFCDLRTSMFDEDGSTPCVDGTELSGLCLPFYKFLASPGWCKTFLGAFVFIFLVFFKRVDLLLFSFSFSPLITSDGNIKQFNSIIEWAKNKNMSESHFESIYLLHHVHIVNSYLSPEFGHCFNFWLVLSRN